MDPDPELANTGKFAQGKKVMGGLFGDREETILGRVEQNRGRIRSRGGGSSRALLHCILTLLLGLAALYNLPGFLPWI